MPFFNKPNNFSTEPVELTNQIVARVYASQEATLNSLEGPQDKQKALNIEILPLARDLLSREKARIYKNTQRYAEEITQELSAYLIQKTVELNDQAQELDSEALQTMHEAFFRESTEKYKQTQFNEAIILQLKPFIENYSQVVRQTINELNNVTVDIDEEISLDVPKAALKIAFKKATEAIKNLHKNYPSLSLLPEFKFLIEDLNSLHQEAEALIENLNQDLNFDNKEKRKEKHKEFKKQATKVLENFQNGLIRAKEIHEAQMLQFNTLLSEELKKKETSLLELLNHVSEDPEENKEIESFLQKEIESSVSTVETKQTQNQEELWSEARKVFRSNIHANNEEPRDTISSLSISVKQEALMKYQCANVLGTDSSVSTESILEQPKVQFRKKTIMARDFVVRVEGDGKGNYSFSLAGPKHASPEAIKAMSEVMMDIYGNKIKDKVIVVSGDNEKEVASLQGKLVAKGVSQIPNVRPNSGFISGLFSGVYDSMFNTSNESFKPVSTFKQSIDQEIGPDIRARELRF